jgi:hypothetical protein
MTLTTRLARLQKLWPLQPCAECRKRPAIVCIAEGEEPPRFEDGVCPRCGTFGPTVVVMLASADVCLAL